MNNEQDLATLQEEMFYRLTNDPFLANVTIFLRRRGVVDSDIANRIGPSNVRNGLAGAAMIVMMPFVDVPENGSVGPQCDILPIVRSIERPTINQAVGGTGITAEALGLRSIRLFHLWPCDALNANLYADKRAMRPAPIKVGTDVGYDTFFHCSSGFNGAAVSRPVITNVAGAAQIACNTPLAQIWVTTDGSYPAPNSGTSQLYNGPLAVAAGSLVRACGYLGTVIPSGVSRLQF